MYSYNMPNNLTLLRLNGVSVVQLPHHPFYRRGVPCSGACQQWVKLIQAMHPLLQNSAFGVSDLLFCSLWAWWFPVALPRQQSLCTDLVGHSLERDYDVPLIWLKNVFFLKELRERDTHRDLSPVGSLSRLTTSVSSLWLFPDLGQGAEWEGNQLVPTWEAGIADLSFYPLRPNEALTLMFLIL